MNCKFKNYKLWYFTILIAFQHTATAQKWEYGLAIGASNYYGDLAQNVVIKESHPAFGILGRYNFNNYWSMRAGLTYGQISGSDENFKEYKYRNLNFKSHLWELSNIMEFNYLPFGSNPRTSSFTSYFLTGWTLCRMNPQAHYNGRYFDLKPLRTEGQSNKETYSLIQLAIPVGGGIKYSPTKNWIFAFEMGWRRTFTDYVDDVSTTYPDRETQLDQFGQLSADLSDRSWEVEGVGEPLAQEGNMRGDPNFKDWYIFSMLSVSYRFTPIQCWPKQSRY